MRKTLPGGSLLRFALSAGLTAILCGPMAPAVAEDLSGFSVMLQLGDSFVPHAIEIAPNDRWFLAASPSAIYLSDLETGSVLRRLVAPGFLTRVAISKDGSAVLAKYSLDDGSEGLFGWSAETGLPIEKPESEAPAPDGPNWSSIEGKWPGAGAAPYDDHAPQKYLLDQKIDQLVDVNRVERVEATNRPNIVQVTVAGEQFDGDEAFAAYRYYFIDVLQKRIVVEVSGKTLNTFCGQPHGAFGFDGRYLVVAPTELDASASFINSVVIDTEAKPPVVKWSRPCQDFQVAGMAMQRGLIVVSPSPDKARIWDPATARQLAVFDDMYDGDVLAWSHDLTTFAAGVQETLDNNQGYKFGVSLVRSGKTFFIPTDQQIQEIRLSPSGSAVFARTQAGWSAWDASDGKSLPTGPLPLSEEDFQIWNDRAVTSPDGKFRIIDQRQLVDTATGRILFTALNLRLSDGWKYVWASSDSRSITVWDVASGQKLWTVTANDTNDKDFLVVEFPDDRLRLSEGAERLVSLVRGYQVRPFDDVAKRAFLHP